MVLTSKQTNWAENASDLMLISRPRLLPKALRTPWLESQPDSFRRIAISLLAADTVWFEL
jgi:hypothetical protein